MYNYNDIGFIRNKCKHIAIQFGFNSTLFGRIPMHIFRYFSVEDPFCGKIRKGLTEFSIPTVFYFVNRIPLKLWIAWYTCRPRPSAIHRKLVDAWINIDKNYSTNKQNIDWVIGYTHTFALRLSDLKLVDIFGNTPPEAKKRASTSGGSGPRVPHIKIRNWTPCSYDRLFLEKLQHASTSDSE